MKLPRQFFAPLAIGAPAPLRELPVRLERMIHFVPPHVEKVRAKVPELARQVDVVLGNLEDAIPVDAKQAARDGLHRDGARRPISARPGLWTRINALNSPWVLDDVTEIVAAVGNKLDVIMLPKVDGPWDIHYLDQLLAQLEARHKIKKPILIHAILETAQGVNNVEAIATASPRMHGMSLGPADLAASRAMKTTRVGGGHPEYKVLADATRRHAAARRLSAGPLALHHRQDGRRLRRRRHQAVLRPVRRFLRRRRLRGAIPQRVPHGLPRRLVAAPLADRHRQESVLARSGRGRLRQEIVAAMPDGAGAVMIDGKMQDDATWKQAKVLLDLARLVAAKDPDMGARYAL